LSKHPLIGQTKKKEKKQKRDLKRGCTNFRHAGSGEGEEKGKSLFLRSKSFKRPRGIET